MDNVWKTKNGIQTERTYRAFQRAQQITDELNTARRIRAGLKALKIHPSDMAEHKRVYRDVNAKVQNLKEELRRVAADIQTMLEEDQQTAAERQTITDTFFDLIESQGTFETSPWDEEEEEK